MSYKYSSKKVLFKADPSALPAAPYIGCAELPPLDYGSPQCHSFSGGLQTPPWSPATIPPPVPHQHHLSPIPVQFGISPALAQMSIDIACDPYPNSQSMQLATYPALPFFYLVSRVLSQSILVQAKDGQGVTILDIHKALHHHLYHKLKRSEMLQCAADRVNASFEQRMLNPRSRTNNIPYPCRIDALCGRTDARFGRFLAGNNGMEMEIDFY